jgi:UDP-2,3-diacylglucosamine hydrolase
MWVFLSDVHLIESNSNRGKKILSFLELVKNQLDGLAIVGDLFDFWFGYKTVIFNQFFPILSKINEIRERGCRIIYIAGNHDFHFGPIFDKVIPIETHQQPCTLELDGKTILLHHGDGIDNKDIRYNFFKFIIRSCFATKLSEFLHPNLGWKIAKALSKTSHSYFHKKSKKERYLKACDDYSMKKFREGYDIIIFGHLHDPYMKMIVIDGKKKIFVNLGDWIYHDTFLKYDNSTGFELMHFDLKGCKIEKFKAKESS